MTERETGTNWTRGVSAALTIFACTISGGLLTLPSVFKDATIGPALLLMLLSAITTTFSLVALVECAAADKNVQSYSTLVSSRGRCSARWMDGIIGLFLTGVAGSSIIVVRDFLTQEIQSYPAVADGATAMVGLCIALLSLPSSMGALVHAATASTVAFCFLVFTFMWYGAHEMTSATCQPEWWPNGDSPVASKMGSALPILLYAFGCQFQMFDIYQSWKDDGGDGAVSLFLPVIIAAVLLMTVLFSIVGVFGVYSFPDEQTISGDVLQMLARKGQLGAVARVLLVIAVCVASPIVIIIARSSLASSLGIVGSGGHSGDRQQLDRDNGDSHQLCHNGFGQQLSDDGHELSANADGQEPPRPRRGSFIDHLQETEDSQQLSAKQRVGMTLAITCVATSLALARVDFLIVIGAMGAFFCPPLLYIVPGVALLKMSHQEGRHQLLEPEDELEAATEVKHNRGVGDSLGSSCAAMVMGTWLIGFGSASYGIGIWAFFN